MKYRESGMPLEEQWKSYFKPLDILKEMGVNKNIKTLIDIGCGYGTFLLPAAKIISGKAIGIDIDESMIEVCRKKVEDNGILNINLINGDISTKGTMEELKSYENEVDYITLFNILHCEKPLELLRNVYNILNENGKIGIIHWKNEETPRGPSMEIRPEPEAIIEWASEVGFTLDKKIDIPPYHFGLVFIKGVTI